jgi:hypothetical protein
MKGGEAREIRELEKATEQGRCQSATYILAVDHKLKKIERYCF